MSVSSARCAMTPMAAADPNAHQTAYTAWEDAEVARSSVEASLTPAVA